jgi:predicted acyltransferase
VTPPPAPPRLLSVDALRGLTVGAMVLVNNPGSWSAV